MNKNMLQLFKERQGVRVLYAYDEIQKYIEHVAAYAKHGIEAGDHIVLIENPRLSPKIYSELESQLTKEQMEFIHFVKSFDFYFSNGSYHPPAIQLYFEKMLQPFIEEQATYRAWVHVEWASGEFPMHLIEDFEKVLDVSVKNYQFPLICAYDDKLLEDPIRDMLLKKHPYILGEDDIVVSDLYVTTEA
ncbi:MEDS domain-containing protein [Planococcus halocryophilus]|uniref:MEDS domain-containing protein n=1 Tax=Planococcus halocryophilus TaxID=1215089 RepID=UPI001F0F5752|nr:MEDS domain-containing protein [Planococcus halocryophilus]MCH4826724.1 MEDS domain-containing protein [Planococcus halocryophilus]